jgi:magnesium-transporting ATPase (P-type)
VGGNLGLFLWELDRGQEVKVARTATVNLLMLGEVFYLFNCRRLTASILSWDGLTGNRYVLLAILVLIGLQWLFTYQPTLQALFHTADLDGAVWGRILAFGFAVLLLVELEKVVVRRIGRWSRRQRGPGRP